MDDLIIALHTVSLISTDQKEKMWVNFVKKVNPG